MYGAEIGPRSGTGGVAAPDTHDAPQTTPVAINTGGSESEGEPTAVRRPRGCGGELAELARMMASEACGTLLLLLLTCLPAVAGAPLLLRATTAGLVVALLVQCFDHISGAMFNPTVTLAALVSGRLPAARAAALVAAQAAGAAAAAAALDLLAPAGSATCSACLTKPALDIPVFRALCLEMVLGGCLALANCAAWDSRNRRLLDSWPLRIGLAVVALSLVGGDLTGASMNPMRSLGPALCAGDWTHHWIYWVGPPTGSVLFTMGYRVTWAAAPRALPRGTSPLVSRRPASIKLYTPA